MKSDADISQLFACHQFALDMFQRDIFGFRNEPESDAHKRNVQRSVEPERTGSANAIKQCQEGPPIIIFDTQFVVVEQVMPKSRHFSG